MSDPKEVFKNALDLDIHNRAALAQRLLASLEDLSEEEADRVWADETQRRLEEYRAGRAIRGSSARGGEEGRKTVSVILVKYHEAAEDEMSCSMRSDISSCGLRAWGGVSSPRF